MNHSENSFKGFGESRGEREGKREWGKGENMEIDMGKGEVRDRWREQHFL